MNEIAREAAIHEVYVNGDITLQEKELLSQLNKLNKGSSLVRSLKISPNKAVLLKEEGNSKFKQKHFNRALDYYEVGILVDPGNLDIWNNKRLLLNKLGNGEEVDYCNEMIEKIKNNPSIIKDLLDPTTSVVKEPIDSMKKFCRHCGAKLNDSNSKFCNSCGKNLLDAPPSLESSQNLQTPSSNENNTIGRVFDF